MPCPLCQGEMRVRDTVLRHMRDADSVKHWYKIRRLQCKECKRIHRELPDKAIPYKHYEALQIEGALDERKPICAADNSTLSRWRRWYVWIAAVMDAALIAIQTEINGLLQPLIGEQSPLKARRDKGGGWLAETYGQTINAGYPAYTPSLRMSSV